MIYKKLFRRTMNCNDPDQRRPNLVTTVGLRSKEERPTLRGASACTGQGYFLNTKNITTHTLSIVYSSSHSIRARSL